MEVLDHGYVNYVEHWGSDARIIEAARMSTNKGFLGWETDAKLLSYLWTQNHHTPFEMAGLTVEVQAPIFVFREWQRHRTQSYNELSARYTELPNLFYIPSLRRLMDGKQSTKNKQGSEAGFSEGDAQRIQADLIYYTDIARVGYQGLLNAGLSRELARLVVPVNQYSRMRACSNLRNWLAFLTLRTDPAAQMEIRAFAEAVGEILLEHFPRTYALWAESSTYKKESHGNT